MSVCTQQDLRLLVILNYTHKMKDPTTPSWDEYACVYNTHKRPHNIRVLKFSIFECIQNQCLRRCRGIKIMVCISVAIFSKAFSKIFLEDPTMYGYIGRPPVVW